MKSALASLLATAAFGFALMAIPAAAEDAKPLDKAQVEAIVKQVIENNPELIIRAVNEYEIRQQMTQASNAAKNVVALKEDIDNDPLSPSIGNPKGDVTLVEFFDYHCGYCKHFFPVISKLVQEDKKVRVVFKEFPILSEDSSLAARAALAVNSIDKSKYFAFHSALMDSSGSFTEESLIDVAQKMGIDPDQFRKALQSPDIDKELAHTKRVAKDIDVEGTPGLVIGHELVSGAVSLDALKDKIANQRKMARDEEKNG